MKKSGKILITVILILAGAGTWFFFFRKTETPLVLQTEKPRYGYIAQSVTATGNIQPVDTVTIGSQVSGIIKALYTDFNAKVKKGQLLAQLDKSLFQATVDQNRAGLLSAQSQLIYQQANYQRQETLYKVGAISKADYDNSVSTLGVSKAAVESAKAQLASALKNLSYTDIYSPMDGVVLTRNISVGQTVAASFNTPTFFTIAKDITKMQVQANVDEADIGNVLPNLRVTFTVDAFLDDVFQGSVQEVRLKPTTSANVVTYTTIINAPNDDQKLKPGMTANVTIYTKEVDSALLISAKALKYQPDARTAQKYTLVPLQDSGSAKSGEEKNSPRSGNGIQNRPRSTSSPARHAGTMTGGDTTTKKIKDSTQVQASQRGRVWVLAGTDKLVQKRIRTGLNNDTEVEVLKGLGPDDVVVTGTEQAAAAGNTKTPAAKSPFMPTRPGRGGGRR